MLNAPLSARTKTAKLAINLLFISHLSAQPEPQFLQFPHLWKSTCHAKTEVNAGSINPLFSMRNDGACAEGNQLAISNGRPQPSVVVFSQ
jgi:hypothetical protein